MKLENIAKNGLIDLAKSSSDVSVLKGLSSSVNTLVRRAVARNEHTPIETLELLCKDPVLNVSYMAFQNRNCSLYRDFSGYDHPCVQCAKDERSMDCSQCNM